MASDQIEALYDDLPLRSFDKSFGRWPVVSIAESNLLGKSPTLGGSVRFGRLEGTLVVVPNRVLRQFTSGRFFGQKGIRSNTQVKYRPQLPQSQLNLISVLDG